MMGMFRKKPVVIEAITFDEFVQYGIDNGNGHLVNGHPWSFEYKGHQITHENDNCYLIPTLEGTMRFNRGDMLITGVNGEIYPCKMDIFVKTYEDAALSHEAATDAESESEVHYLKRKLAYRDTEIEELKRQIESHRERENQPTPDKQTTDTEVQAAIKWFTKEHESITHYGRMHLLPSGQIRAKKSYDLAIRALQQYQTKPCDKCVESIGIKEPVEFDFDDREYSRIGWEWKAIKPNYCQNCGRKLKEVTS